MSLITPPAFLSPSLHSWRSWTREVREGLICFYQIIILTLLRSSIFSSRKPTRRSGKTISWRPIPSLFWSKTYSIRASSFISLILPVARTYAERNQPITSRVLIFVSDCKSIGRLVDYIGSHPNPHVASRISSGQRSLLEGKRTSSCHP